MYIVAGQYKGKEIGKDIYISFSSDGRYLRNYENKCPEILVKDQVAALEVVHESKATGGGVGGAAGGAVLGFLVAGPLGTALGAAAGSKKRGTDDLTIALSLMNGDALIIRRVKPEDLAQLKALEISSAKKVSAKKKKLESGSTASQDINLESTKVSKNEVPSKMPPVIKGRSKKENSLPELAFLTDFKSAAKEINEVAAILVHRTLPLINEYNTFKWRYFDESINSELELNSILALTINLAVHQIDERPKLLRSIEDSRRKLTETLSEFEAATRELEEAQGARNIAGFFERKKLGRVADEKFIKKRELEMARNGEEWKIKDCEERLVDIGKLGEIKNAFALLKEFVESIFTEDKHEELLQKPAKKITIDRKVFFRIYQISKASELEKKSQLTEEAQLIEPVPKTGIKEKMLDLKELFDSGIITEEEYESKRKQLLDEL